MSEYALFFVCNLNCTVCVTFYLFVCMFVFFVCLLLLFRRKEEKNIRATENTSFPNTVKIR